MSRHIITEPVAITETEMNEVCQYSARPLKADQIYCFCVLICDNEIDRDEEKFSVPALRKLAELFRGRTSIFDHGPRGDNQTARIYKTEIKTFAEELTQDGEEYTALIGYAYMVRTEANRPLIEDIDNGVKKEVSISCSMAKKTCSICGCNQFVERCKHIKGAIYGDGNGSFCYYLLEEPIDVYEWAFVG